MPAHQPTQPHLPISTNRPEKRHDARLLRSRRFELRPACNMSPISNQLSLIAAKSTKHVAADLTCPYRIFYANVCVFIRRDSA
jgi:hypothetical protein